MGLVIASDSCRSASRGGDDNRKYSFLELKGPIWGLSSYD